MDESEVTILSVVRRLWPKRWAIAGITLVFVVASGIAAWTLPKEYEAKITISPTSSPAGGGQLGGLGGLASQFGGLASLAGISLGGENSKKAESVAVLQSEALTERYIKENNLLPVIYEEKWDSSKSKWKTSNPKKIPTLWKANEYFKKNIRDVTTNTKTGLVTMSIKWKSAATAAKWANDLVAMTNEYMRSKAILEAERNIEYLKTEALKTNIVEAKQAIYSIMQNELNHEMLARGNEEYAFRIVDPAVEPEKEVFPIKIVWLLSGLFGGLLVSSLFFYLQMTWKSKTQWS
jgi:uncharacterized protein involved in exopolysaccharide biosynthesis